MSAYLSLNVHVIFATRHRAPMIGDTWRSDLHAYIGGTVRGLQCIPLAVGGVADHVHILAGLRGVDCVSNLVREVKKASSVWARQHYDQFGWQNGYAA